MTDLGQAQHAVLLSNSWFAELPVEIQRALTSHGKVQDVAAGGMIYIRGGAADGLYCVLKGAVRLSGTSMRGKEATLDLLEPGQWFGELSMIDGLPRVHDAWAHVASRVLLLPPAHFQSLLQTHPSFARHLLLLQSSRMRALLAGVEAFLVRPGEELFAVRLLDLASHYGTQTNRGVEIDLPLPQDLLSQLVGVSRQRVSQILRLWEQEAIISQHYGHIIVLDLARLKLVAGA